MFGTNPRASRSTHKEHAKTPLPKRERRHLRNPFIERLENRQLMDAADPVINEFMASNKTGIIDNFGDNSDWIELYNGTGAPVNLAGWHLSNDITLPAEWTFPNVTINANQYMIVWASGRNLTDPAQPLHTDFKLDPNPGEYLALTRPDNSVATEFNPTYPEQLNNISYGLSSTGVYQYMTTPTPGAANVDGANGLVADTKFSVDRGLFTAPFQLTITTATAGTTIRYTTDGTPPTATTGNVYSGPITINHTTTLRAAAFRTGYLSSNVDTETYLFLNDVIHQPNLPITSITRIGTVATVTTPIPHGFVAGNSVLIYGADQTQYDTVVNAAPFTILTVPTPTTFTYTVASTAVTPATGATMRIANPAGFPGSWGTYADGTPATADYEMDPEVVNDSNYSTRIIDALSSIPTLSIVMPTSDLFNNTNTPGVGGIYSFPLTGVEADVPLKTVGSITRNGNIATVNLAGHGYVNGDRIWIQNANQADYNGTFTIFGVTSNTFQYNIPTTAPLTATGTIFAQKKNVPQFWERAGSVEWINPDGSKGFQINGGVQIQGNASREPNKSGKHSFRLLFKTQYGDSHLDYPIFGDNAPSVFDSLILKAGFNNSWIHWDPTQRGRGTLISDRWASQAQLDMGDASKHGKFVQLYLNGAYWGVYDVMERPEASFAASAFGGNTEDYDVMNNTDVLIDGNRLAWDQMFTLANTTDLSQTANYNAIKQYLDVPSFIDYILLNYYAGNLDWDDHNWYAARHSRVDGVPTNIDGFHFFSYDAENILNSTTDNVTALNNDHRPTRLFQTLKNNAEFRQAVADRIHQLFFNGGPLSPSANAARYRAEMDEVDPAVIAESARWGDYRRDVNQKAPNFVGPAILYTRDGSWVPETNRVLNTYFPIRTSNVLNQLRAINLYPNMDAPEFNQLGGAINPGFALSMTNVSGGTVYYTLDGTDPRVVGGAVSAGALTYSSVVTLNASARVLARVYNPVSHVWSALTDFTFNVLPAPALRITEMMYNPKKPVGSLLDDDEYQFIELQNIGATSINLFGIVIKGVNDFVFPDMNLAAGARILVVANQTAFESVYGAGKPIAGTFSGRLSHSGEKITLQTALGQIIEQFTYSDGWYGDTDGDGYTIVAVDPNASNDVLSTQEGWRASTTINGAPGVADSGLNNNSIVINEVLTNTASDPWIEFKNNTAAAIDISGWYLTDDELNRTKYALPAGSIVPANGYLTLFQSSSFGSAFTLQPVGGELHLASSYSSGLLGGYRDGVDFGTADPEVTFGRYIKSTGGSDFTALTTPTPNAANATPIVGPVVINEVMYNAFNGADEFIEIKNITGAPIALNDGTNGWAFTSGVSFTFAPGASLAGGEIALIVPIDPAVFRTKYSIPAPVQIFGPYTGTLSNNGEKLALSHPLPGVLPVAYVQVDRVNYNDNGAWPIFANGIGSSLQRRSDSAYTNDVTNWGASASGGTPGAANVLKSPPVVNAGADATINEGGALSSSGSFTDTDVSDTFTATVNWGDSGSPVALTLNANKTFSLSHVYTDSGVYTVTVIVTDSGKLFGTDTVLVTVNNVIPNGTVPTPASVNEGSAGSITISTRTDPSTVDSTAGFLINLDYNNDGFFEVTNSTLTTFTVPASFLLEGPSTRTSKLRLVDKDGGFRDFLVNINVLNLPPTATLANSGPAPEGSTTTTVSFSNIADSPGDVAAGFTYSYDFNNDSVFEISNSTSSSVAIPAQYLPDGPGNATIHARITDRDGGFRDYTTPVTINNVAPTIAQVANKMVGMGTPLIIAGSVSDPGSIDTFTGTIDYGDGAGAQPLTISPNGAYSVNKTYSTSGLYTVTINATDKDGAGATPMTFTVNVRGSSLTGTAAADNYYIRLNPAHTSVEFYENAAPPGAPTFVIPVASLTNISIDGQGGDDSLTIDFGNTNPIPSGGLSYTAGASASGDTLTIIGDGTLAASAALGATLGNGTVTIAARGISYSGVETISAGQLSSLTLTTPNAADNITATLASSQTTVTGSSGATALPAVQVSSTGSFILDTTTNDGGGGDDSFTINSAGNFSGGSNTLAINAGTGNNTALFNGGTTNLDTNLGAGGANLAVTLANSAVLNLPSSQTLKSLTLNGTSRVSFAGSGKLLRLGDLSVLSTAKLDLDANDMIVQATAANRQTLLSSIFNSIKSARNTGPSRWTGTGLTSAAAANDPKHITGLAAILNDNGAGGTLYPTFDGQPVDINSILVKYTYDGDANVDGQINADDFAAIDGGFATHATGYAHGDFNYTGGQPNSDDYFTIDHSFSDQGAVLATPPAPQAPLAAEVTASSSPTPAAPVGAASVAAPSAPTDSDSPKRNKHRHHKRNDIDERVRSEKSNRSDALARFLRRR